MCLEELLLRQQWSTNLGSGFYLNVYFIDVGGRAVAPGYNVFQVEVCDLAKFKMSETRQGGLENKITHCGSSMRFRHSRQTSDLIPKEDVHLIGGVRWCG
jgi:hypothetical protein